MNTSTPATMETMSYITTMVLTTLENGLPVSETPSGFTKEQERLRGYMVLLRLLIAIFAVLTNITVIWLQIKYNLFRKTTYFFGLFVNMSDLAFSACVIVECFCHFQCGGSSIMLYAALVTISQHSLVCMCGVAIDRYLALCAIPLTYKQVVNLKKYMAAIFISFTVLVCLNFLLFKYLVTSYIAVVIKWVPCIITGSLLPVASIYFAIGTSLSKSYNHLNLPTQIKIKRIRRTRAIMLTFYSVLFTNIITYMPTCVVAVFLWTQPMLIKPYEDLFVNVLISNVTYNFSMLNYVINPIIYVKLILIKNRTCPFCGEKPKEISLTRDAELYIRCSDCNLITL